jgi:hypothetical protein
MRGRLLLQGVNLWVRARESEEDAVSIMRGARGCSLSALFIAP